MADPEDVPRVAVGVDLGIWVLMLAYERPVKESADPGSQWFHAVSDAKVPVGIGFEDEGGGDVGSNHSKQ